MEMVIYSYQMMVNLDKVKIKYLIILIIYILVIYQILKQIY